MIGFSSTSVTLSLNYTQYSAIADLHNLEFTVTHALGFSVFTRRVLAMDFNTYTSSSNHYEVFLLFRLQLLCTPLSYLYSINLHNSRSILVLELSTAKPS
jgi:hypothetical protein